MEADLVIRSVLLPAVAVAVAAVLLSLVAGRSGGRAGAVVAALLPVIAVLPAFRALAVQEGALLASGLPQSVSYGWLPTAMLVGACCAGAIAGVGPRAAVPVAATVASFAAMALVSPPGFRGGEAQVIAAAAAAVSATVSAIAPAADPAGGHACRAPFVSWWIVLSVAAGFAIASGFAKLAFIAASLAAASAALGTVSLGSRAIRPGPSLAIAFAIALAATCFVGMAYDEAPLPKGCWAVLALSPAASSLSWVSPLRDRPFARMLVRQGAPPAAAAAALVAALLATSPRGADRADDAYASAAFTSAAFVHSR